MGHVQVGLLEMLADFYKEGKEGAKDIGEKLLNSWPVSPSQRHFQELRRDLRKDLEQKIAEVSEFLL